MESIKVRNGLVQHGFTDGLYLRSTCEAAAADAQPLGTQPLGTLLYIHGLGESGLGFENQLADPRLAAWRQLAVDLPGYGKTPWREQPLDLDGLADLLAAWLRGRGEAPVVLVGHSMGGVLGLLLCERAPELVRAFVNVEGNISLDDCGFSSKAAAYSLADFVNNGFAAIAQQLYLDGVEDLALRTYYPSLRLCDPRQYHRNSLDLVALSKAAEPGAAVSDTGELAARLANLTLPQIYLLGDPRGTGEFSRSRLREAGVEYWPIAHAGHWPFLDQPDAFVRDLLKFLDALE